MVRRGITSLWPCDRERLTANRDEDTFILMITASKKKKKETGAAAIQAKCSYGSI